MIRADTTVPVTDISRDEDTDSDNIMTEEVFTRRREPQGWFKSLCQKRPSGLIFDANPQPYVAAKNEKDTQQDVEQDLEQADTGAAPHSASSLASEDNSEIHGKIQARPISDFIPRSAGPVAGFTDFRKWLYNHKDKISTKATGKKFQETHLLLDGGKFSIPDSLTEEFSKRYAKSLFEGERMYVVERRTKIFGMFAELDYKSIKPLSELQVLNIARALHELVVTGYGSSTFVNPRLSLLEDPLRLIVSNPDKIATDEKGFVKSGIHLHWRIPVNDETAKRLRVLFIERLKTLLKQNLPNYNIPFVTDDLDKKEEKTIGKKSKEEKEDHTRAKEVQEENVVVAGKNTTNTSHQLSQPTSQEEIQISSQEENQTTSQQIPKKDITTFFPSVAKKNMFDLKIFTEDTAPTVSWNEIFDVQIYEGCGLRMMGSRKAKKCDSCDGIPVRRKKNTNCSKLPLAVQQMHGTGQPDIMYDLCSACGGSGRIDEGRPYFPMAVLDRNGNANDRALHLLLSDTLLLINQTSLRAPLGEEVLVPKSVTFKNELKNVSLTETKKRGPKHVPHLEGVDEKDIEERRKKCDGEEVTFLEKEDKRFDELTETIVHLFRLPEGPKCVRSIIMNSDNSLYVVNTSSHHCHNKKGMHSHATVYFVVKPYGICQKCFSKKPVIYSSGKSCEQYNSNVVGITPTLKELLFSRKIRSKQQVAHAMQEISRIENGMISSSETPIPRRILQRKRKEAAATLTMPLTMLPPGIKDLATTSDASVISSVISSVTSSTASSTTSSTASPISPCLRTGSSNSITSPTGSPFSPFKAVNQHSGILRLDTLEDGHSTITDQAEETDCEVDSSPISESFRARQELATNLEQDDTETRDYTEIRHLSNSYTPSIEDSGQSVDDVRVHDEDLSSHVDEPQLSSENEQTPRKYKTSSTALSLVAPPWKKIRHSAEEDITPLGPDGLHTLFQGRIATVETMKELQNGLITNGMNEDCWGSEGSEELSLFRKATYGTPQGAWA